ncbi:MAG: hypothetical protein IJO46_08285, partial [Thermoguttaceae bacterium]|nr:hypothetical protein [Thermoguttaceae bacterium]
MEIFSFFRKKTVAGAPTNAQKPADVLRSGKKRRDGLLIVEALAVERRDRSRRTAQRRPRLTGCRSTRFQVALAPLAGFSIQPMTP